MVHDCTCRRIICRRGDFDVYSKKGHENLALEYKRKQASTARAEFGKIKRWLQGLTRGDYMRRLFVAGLVIRIMV